eukprot:Pgem_evm1s16284
MLKVSGSIFILTGPHHTSAALSPSQTIRLSLGLRPHFLPERVANAPELKILVPG